MTVLATNTTRITYTSVGVILKVTPFITEDGMVEMIVSPQISEIDPTLSIPISTECQWRDRQCPGH